MEDNAVPTQSNDDGLFAGSSNYEIQKFVVDDSNSMRIKPTIASLAAGVTFTLMALGLIGYWGAAKFGFLNDTVDIPVLIGGLIFLALGLMFYRGNNEQIVIDKEAGLAFIRSWSPTVSLNTKAVSKQIKPDEIVAIQRTSRVVETLNRKRKKKFVQHQVNVYTSDEKRHHVFVTLKPENAENFGNKLAEFFGVPLHNNETQNEATV